MSPIYYYPKLNCALTRHLIQASQANCAATAAMAGAALALLGFFDDQAAPDLAGVEDLVRDLSTVQHKEFIANMADRCVACRLAAECEIGRVVLRQDGTP